MTRPSTSAGTGTRNIKRKAFEYPRPLPKRRGNSLRKVIAEALIEEMGELGWVPGDPTVRGTPTTVRFLYYRLVSRGVIKKSGSGSRGPDQYVSVIMGELRHAQVFPLDSIVDRKRSVRDFTGWDDLWEGATETVQGLRSNPWNESEVPQIWVESESLAGAIEPITRKYRVPLVAFGGQASIGLLSEVAANVTDGTMVMYLGDADLSGEHIEASAIERVEAYAGGISLNIEKLAVTDEQIRQFDLPVIQKYDKRTKRSYPAVETEALGQRFIEQLVDTNLKWLLQSLTDRNLYDAYADEQRVKEEILARL